MSLSYTPIWKEAPFIRILPPFIAGIVLQWYAPLSITALSILALANVCALLAFQATSTLTRFRLPAPPGMLINLLLFLAGACITHHNHPASHTNWLPYAYKGQGSIQAVLQEPLSKKNRSYKAIAAARQLHTGNTTRKLEGNIIIYFSPETDRSRLSYGSIIIINKPLQPVKNSGNPGAFDYKRHCTFNRIAFQVYLQPNDFFVSPSKETRGIKKLIFRARQHVNHILGTYIKGAKETGLAQALLIGYKDELDKDLVQSYANTGVVHIIAVSGLHLGIVYWLLSLLLPPGKKPASRLMRLALILAGMWMFSLMAGAGPSVIRSAVMFSFIAIGNTFSRQHTVYNNLAASAFLLLCWNPFWLWDAGFQLSYAAVLSIVLFYRPVYNMLYVRNKLLDAVWKLNAVTLAAQILTIPLCLYHFHQFPVYFLLANLVAVPLSGMLLVGEIILCALAVSPMLAQWMGILLKWSISFLNHFIQRIGELPFASWQHLQINTAQLFLLFAFIPALACWLMQKSKPALVISLIVLAAFTALRTHSFISAMHQHKIIIYNIPQSQAIDFIQSRHYYFTGNAQDLHLQPARTLYRASASGSLPGLIGKAPLFSFNGKKLLVLDGRSLPHLPGNLQVDVLVLSNNPSLHVLRTLKTIQVRQVVADGSNHSRKLIQWQQHCTSLGIPFHSVAESGAFIIE